MPLSAYFDLLLPPASKYDPAITSKDLSEKKKQTRKIQKLKDLRGRGPPPLHARSPPAK